MPLTQAWTQLRPHALQSQIWRTKARFLGLACGRGSGKTELMRRKIVRMLPVTKPWPDPIYAFCLPTREQAKRVAWEKIKALVPDNWVAKAGIRESDLTIETIFGSKLFLVGMDKPQRIEGVQWDMVVIDESCDQQPGSYDRSVRPALSHRNGKCARIGVPKRFGPGAAEFKQFCEEAAAGKLGSDHEAYNWPSWDILPPEEIEAARRALDPRDFEEQYGASWQGTSGLIFYAFSETENVAETAVYDPGLPLLVGSDFNVSPMAWVIGQKTRGLEHLRVIDEIYVQNTNTQATLDRLHGMYPGHKSGWMFFGDATGRARKTSAASTDYAQIANDERFELARIAYPRSNPARVDRFASCNAMFRNALGERRCWVHPKCLHLIHDLTNRAYKPGTRDPEEGGGPATNDGADMGHISDAIGYLIHYLWPVIPKEEGSGDVRVSSGS